MAIIKIKTILKQFLLVVYYVSLIMTKYTIIRYYRHFYRLNIKKNTGNQQDYNTC